LKKELVALDAGGHRRGGLSGLSLVCIENLNPSVVVMKSAKDGERFDASGPLNRTTDRRTFAQ
jgi:hypothetical protein